MHKATMALALLTLPLFSATSMAGPPAFPEGAIHVGVVVEDLAKSTAFYTGVLGMTKTGEFDVDAAFGKASGLTGGLPFHVNVLRLLDQPNAAQFKLMSFGKGTRTARGTHIQDALGIRYLTLDVLDLTPFVARLKAAAIPLLGQTPIPLGDSANQFVLIQDPDGTFIELIGPMK